MSLMAIQRWLGLRVELLSNALILVVALVCIAQRHQLSPGLAALALSQATSTTGLLNFVIRMLADTEAQMSSVERVLEFAHRLPQEKQQLLPLLPPASSTSTTNAQQQLQQQVCSTPPAGGALKKEKQTVDS